MSAETAASTATTRKETLRERIGLTSCRIPLSRCFRRKTRRVLLVSSVLRILLILATIPIAYKSVQEGNFPGEKHYMTFYWTDLLVLIGGVQGLYGAAKLHESDIQWHSWATILLGLPPMILQTLMALVGVFNDGKGVNPTPETHIYSGRETTEYHGNDANPAISGTLFAIATLKLLTCVHGGFHCYDLLRKLLRIRIVRELMPSDPIILDEYNKSEYIEIGQLI